MVFSRIFGLLANLFSIAVVYLPIFAFLFVAVSMYVARDSDIRKRIERFSFVLGLQVMSIIALKNLDIVFSQDLHRIVLAFLYIFIATIVIFDLLINRKRFYSFSPLVILILINISHRPSLPFLVSNFALTFLLLISSQISKQHFFRGIVQGCRTILCLGVFRFLIDPVGSFEFGIGDSFFSIFGMQGRFKGILEQPNGLSLICVITFILNVRRDKFTTSLLCAAILMSGSKTSLICLVILWLLDKFNLRFRRRYVVIFAMITTAIPIFSVIFPNSLNSFGGRREIWAYALDSWTQKPFFGLGGNFWSDSISNGLVPVYAGQAHSQILETLIQAGAFGLLLLVFSLAEFCKVLEESRFHRGFVVTLLIMSITESPLGELGVYSIMSIIFVVLLKKEKLNEYTYPRPE